MTADAPVPLEDLLAERGWVRGLARSLVRDDADADDLAQDAWHSALRTPPRAGGSVRAWFATVLRNRARDLRRDGARRAAAVPAAADDPEAFAAATPSPAVLAERAEIERRVLDVVVSLDEMHRDVVLLRFWRGLGADEIAKLRGIPPATARTRLHRALAEVRRRLDRDCGGPEAWRAALVPLAGAGDATGTVGNDSATAARPARMWSAVPTMVSAVATLVLVAIAFVAFRALHVGETKDTTSGAGSPAAVPATSDTSNTAAARPPRARAAAPGEATAVEAEDAKVPGAAAPTTPEKSPAGAVLRVHVRDASRRPVVGAQIHLPSSDKAPIVRRTQDAPLATDAAGDVRVEWSDATVRVRVLAQHEGSAGLSPALEIDAARGPADADVVLGDARPVRGVVHRPDGGPAAGARVTLSGSFDDAYETVAATTTDAAGRFDLGPIPLALATREGSVETTAAGFPRVWTTLEGVADPGALTVRLASAMVVTGRVVDERGAPVPGVSVDVTGASTVVSEADGRFRSEPLAPAAVRVVLLPDEHAPAVVVLADAVSGDRDVGDVVLVPGRAIRGRVVTEDGAPSPRANVYVDDVTVDQVVRQGQADAEGRFVFEHLGAGLHVVHAQAQDGGGAHAGHEGEVSGVRAGDEDVRVVVGPGRTVLVLFVDDATGEPVGASGVKAALLLVDDPNVGARSSYGGEDLRSVRISVRRDGTYELTVEVAGFEPFGPVKVEVTAREERRVTARLRRKAK